MPADDAAQSIFEALETALTTFYRDDKGQEALKKIDALVARTGGHLNATEEPIRKYLRAIRELLLGQLSYRGQDVVAVRHHTSACRELLEEVGNEPGSPVPPEKIADMLRRNEMLVLQADMALATESEQAILRQKMQLIVETAAQEDPEDFEAQLVIDQAKASQLSIRLLQALLAMDLGSALMLSEQSTPLVGRLLRATNHSSTTLIDSFFYGLVRVAGLLLSSQCTYVDCLYTAITEELTSAHLRALDEAGVDLGAAREIVNRLVPQMEHFGHNAMTPGTNFEELATVIDTHRDMVCNLAALVKGGLGVRNVTKRATPKFVFYFLSTFLILLVGIRVAGVVPAVGGPEVATILVVSFLAAVIASFGFVAATIIAPHLGLGHLPRARKASPQD